jgi:2-haloacid dehalogenase
MHQPSAATPPRAVLFDAYGTLFDVYSVALLAEQLFPGFGERLSVLWRDKQIEYTRLTSMSGQYRPFWELTRAGLRFAALRLGLEMSAVAEDRLMNQYRHLSNGDPEMLGVAVKSAGFSGLLAHVLSVHPLRKFKTDPACYALGPQALNLPAKDILFVSSNGWDAIGATWYGYTTLWVNRFNLPLEQLDTAPTRTGSSLRDVLDFFPT